MKGTILILDDEPAICSSLRFALEDEYTVIETQTADDCLDVLKERNVDVLLLDLRLGDVHGSDVLREAKRISPGLIVIIITAYGSIQSSVDCIKAGAYSYITKPVDLERLNRLIEEGLRYSDVNRSMRGLDEEACERYAGLGIVGRGRATQQIMALIEKIKDIDSSVLITGESGTGKELVARAIHYLGKRRTGRFEAVNCAAIPGELLESELFGYERGAFTGAVQPKPGRFQIAHGGTLFLDEIGELELALQAKLLRALEDKEIMPLGGTVSHVVDVRIVASTNKSLGSLIDRRQFREDLFYRLNVINIDMPPLRERVEDLPTLVAYFIKKKARLLGKPIEGIDPSAYSVLEAYSFPGNIRELENMIERAVALGDGPMICLRDLPPHLVEYDFRRHDDYLVRVTLGERLREVEKKVILATLNRVGGNRKETSRLLGISERGLRYKLAQYRMNQKETEDADNS